MSDTLKSFGFAAVLCIVCSFLLTFAASTLKPIQDRNIRADQQKNILKVLGLIESGKKYSSEELSGIYEMSVREVFVDSEGAVFDVAQDGLNPVFVSETDGVVDAYAIPISGFGLWSTLYGYFSLEGDGKTVKGITFYEHGETPGLGAEVEKPWFQDQFKGKRIVNAAGEFVSIGVVKGKVVDKIPENLQDYYVDGISGATVTAKGVETFLRTDLLKYEGYSKARR